MRFNSLEDWLLWQQSCHPNEIELGLDRVSRVAKSMALDLNEPTVITVAGTNGKGSTVAVLNKLLLSAGYTVGCFTSPHFLRYNERIQVNGSEVSDRLIMDSFQRIDNSRGEIPLTYFEFGTLAAIDICQQAALDFVILEVGLGGRLDAVNIIDADLAVITSIAIDHEEWLGSDREQIGREKAGIMRPGKIAISTGLNPPDSLAEVADDLGLSFYQAGRDFSYAIAGDARSMQWEGLKRGNIPVSMPALEFPDLPEESVSGALQALHLLDIDLEKIDFSCLSSISLPGRFQQLNVEGKNIVLDVAHNPAAAEKLAHNLNRSPVKGQTIALLALMADKDINGIIDPLRSLVDRWSLPELRDVPRAMLAADLAAILAEDSSDNISCCESVERGFNEALSTMQPDDRLLVFGSFFTVAAVLAIV